MASELCGVILGMILLVTPQIFDEADELLAPWSAVLDGAPVMRFGFSAAAVLALGAMNWLVCDQDRKDTQVTAESASQPRD